MKRTILSLSAALLIVGNAAAAQNSVLSLAISSINDSVQPNGLPPLVLPTPAPAPAPGPDDLVGTPVIDLINPVDGMGSLPVDPLLEWPEED